jgi:hypothetical protein
MIIKEVKRWKVFSVTGIASGSVTGKIEFKIPKDFISVDDIAFSAIDPATPVSVGVFGSPDKNHVLGTISLHVNNKESNPINIDVQVKRATLITRKKLQPISLGGYKLKGNSLIHGSFVDKGFSNVFPYTLKIYLRGTCRYQLPEQSE